MRSLPFAFLALSFLACSAPEAGPEASESGIGTPAPQAEPIVSGQVAVPMRDGVTLDTNVMLPKGESRRPALLVRTPYPPAAAEQTFGPFTARGYAVVVQSCRGTGASGGVLDPLLQEFDDGQDAVRWLARQPWSNGRVGTIGASYEGFTAIAAGLGRPEVRVVIADGAISDAFSGWPLQRGIPMDTGLLWWLEVVRSGAELMADPGYRKNVTNARPLVDLDVRTLGRVDPSWRAFAAEGDRRSPFWDKRSLLGRMSTLCAPALYFQAANEWSDDPLQAFVEATSSPCSPEVRAQQRFVLGRHGHAGAVYDPLADNLEGRLLRSYLDRFLMEVDVDLSAVPPVQFYVTGAESWGSATVWPPSAATSVHYLDGIGMGLLTAGTSLATVQEIAFDPSADACFRTTPSLGYETAPLGAPITIAGAPELVANVATTTADADLVGVLYERTAAGEMVWTSTQRLRMRFRDGYGAPKAMTPAEPTEVHLRWNTAAHRFAIGNVLGLVLATTECGLPENPGTLASVMSASNAATSVMRVYTGSTRSRLVMPTVAP